MPVLPPLSQNYCKQVNVLCILLIRKETINARSIMSILMLAASKNSHITITVEGEDAEVTMKKLVEALKINLGNETHGFQEDLLLQETVDSEDEIRLQGAPVSG